MLKTAQVRLDTLLERIKTTTRRVANNRPETGSAEQCQDARGRHCEIRFNCSATAKERRSQAERERQGEKT